MRSQSSLIELSAPLVLDASAVINLIATRFAPAIIHALPVGLVAVAVIPAELETGRVRRRKDADGFNELVTAGLIEIVQLGDTAMQYFEELVIGAAADTLDDGEAASIAYALEQHGTALIDESKATRICADRFPELRIGCTVDILIHPEVQRHLGAERLADAVFNALHGARMKVFPQHLDEVVQLIGSKRAALCQSLPRSARVFQERKSVT